MMTTLCEMIMECRAIKGMDRLILYGWAAQLEEGNDAVYASKETVAEFLGVSDDTVLRKTKDLVKAGWLIDTREHKQWKFARTPIRIINVPVIVELIDAQCRNLRPCLEAPPQKAPPQIAAQGSNGSMVLGLDVLSSFSAFSATGVPPLVASKSKEGGQPENLKPRTVEPKPTPHGQRKSCPECGEPLQRDVNHFLECKMAKGRSELDEYLGDMLPRPNPDSMGDRIDLDDDGYGSYGQPLFPSLNSPQAEEARQRVEADRQKEIESILAEGRTTATAAPLHDSPRSASPPRKRCSACGGVEPCRDKWCYAYEPLPKSVDEIPPTSINP
jgi:helix-turn-helix protein